VLTLILQDLTQFYILQYKNAKNIGKISFIDLAGN